VANVSRSAQAAELDLSAYVGMVPVEMLGGNAFPPIGQLNFLLTLAPYGFYWFGLAAENQMPSWHVEPAQSLPDFTTLVLKKRMEELLEAPSRTTLEQSILPSWLQNRRWFAGKDAAIEQVDLAYGVRFGDPQHPVLFSEISVASAGQSSRYQLPFGFIPEDQVGTPLPQQLALSRVRRGRQVGLITDAFSLDTFVHAVLQGIQAGTVLASSDGDIRFESTAELERLGLNAESPVRYLSAEQSNSSVVIGNSMVLKLIRKVASGVHPELEMSAYLTQAGFSNISPLLGAVVRRDAAGEDNLLMIAQGYLSNQGDAWEWTQNNLERALRDELADAMSEQEQHYNALGELKDFAAMLGRRLGEMHQVLAAPIANPDFLPQVITQKEALATARDVVAQIEHALDLLKQHRNQLDPADQALISRLLDNKKAILGHVQALGKKTAGGLRIRVHGDLHLGQVLVIKGDAYLIDFEGEPARPLHERRGKHSPYKDVSGVLRSFDYAAAMAINVQSVDNTAAAAAARLRVTDRYLSEARQAFVHAYRLAAASLAHAWQDPEGEDAALALFGLEKAAYEVAYEAENRPAWLPVPLHGLYGLLSGLKPFSDLDGE
jgi:maltose alpha-D-glucosyltransferase/alpha-amylase